MSNFDINQTGNQGLVEGVGEDLKQEKHAVSQENVNLSKFLAHSGSLEPLEWHTWPSELLEEDRVCGETFADIMKFLKGMCILSDAEQKKQSIYLLERNKKIWENFLGRSKNYNWHLQIFFWITWLYYRTLKNSKVEEYAAKAKNILRYVHKDETNADLFRGIYNMLGCAYTASGKFDLSKKVLMKARKHLKEEFPNDESQTISNSMNRIYLWNCTDRYQSAIDVINSIQPCLEKKRDIHKLCVCDLRKADANIGLNKWQLAKRCLEKCLDRLKGKKNQKIGRALCRIGYICYFHPEEGDAKEYYQKGLAILFEILSAEEEEDVACIKQYLREYREFFRENYRPEIEFSVGSLSTLLEGEEEQANLTDSFLSVGSLGFLDNSTQDSSSLINLQLNSSSVDLLNFTSQTSISEIHFDQLSPFKSLHIFLRSRLELSRWGAQKKAYEEIQNQKVFWESFLFKYEKEKEKDFSVHECRLYLMIAQIFLNAQMWDQGQAWMKKANEMSKELEVCYKTSEFFLDLYNLLSEFDVNGGDKSYLKQSLEIILNFREGNKRAKIDAYVAEGKRSRKAYSKSQIYFQKALALKPKYYLALFVIYNSLASINFALHLDKKGQKWHKKALRIHKRSEEYSYFYAMLERNKGRILYNNNDFTQAKVHYQKALEIIKENLPEGNSLTRKYEQEYSFLLGLSPDTTKANSFGELNYNDYKSFLRHS